jgi:hypothetical protein
MYLGLRVCPILTKFVFYQQIKKSSQYQISQKSVEWGRADVCGQTEITKVLGALRECAKEPKEKLTK